MDRERYLTSFKLQASSFKRQASSVKLLTMTILEGESMKRIKHNDLLPWFTQDHSTLPASYLASCREFFDSIKQQASSFKGTSCDKVPSDKQSKKN
jgi:hypothetical protein